MRIQHNIAAMNAYRNYNTNTSAVAKNLEKLSSGYKINRAGDDAAGLAISEKMRAQISGLNAAQKNVKDGISLVKTAEGAMQEVQDMLNRMVTLATQSANGTYDNEVDRANLQKEVDQLNEEINRIADSANFNGIKLMDGSLEGDTVSYTTRTGSSKDLLLIDNTNGAVNGSTIGGIGTSTFVHQDAQAPSLTEFTLDLEGIEFAGSTGGANAVTFTLGTTNGTAATFGVSLGSAGSFDGKDIAKLIYDGMKDDKFQTTVNGVTFNVKLDGAKLTFTMDEDAASSITSAVTFSGNFSVGVTSGGDLTHVPGSSLIYGTVDIKEGKVASTTKYASTVVDGLAGGTLDKDSPLTFNWFTDGKGIKLGDETYVFALTDETKNAKYGEGIKVIDLTDLVDPDAVPPALKKDAVGGTEQQTLSEVAARLTQAAKDNEMWEVGATADADTTAGAKPDGTTQVIIALREKATYDGDADLTTISQIQKQVQFFDKVTVDENVTKGKGSPLTLQIGDTSESFNQLRVSIGDIHASALGVDKLNIGTQTGAQEAIDTIKNAINQISGIRGTLGATQNRLEHTQNNLSVMAENIQDAESSIRDTDIAEEMMAYTKNNILVQSAQAMLAQANQLPQGVLQLLG